MTAGPWRLLRVKSMTWEADGILGFTLVDPAGELLPAVRAGAHVDVQVAEGIVRQYSLCGDPARRDRYEIAVLREIDGRGGSAAMHERVRAGDLISVGGPRNHFALHPEARSHLLLAGGIGVTPMMSMIAELEAAGATWHLHYCTRSPERTAFTERLEPLAQAGKVDIHHDGGDPARGLDLTTVLAAPDPGTHLYYCGPPGFMTAAAAAAARWPAGSVHFEHFTAPAGPAPDRAVNEAFRIRLQATGDEMEVPPDRTIVQVLREHGHYVDTSCEDGFCGTCLTPYLEGEPEHRDTVLDDDDRQRYVLICCARSRTPTLVLDL